MIKIAILGGSGYTGLELIRILANHPLVEVVVITSRQHKGCKIGEVFPGLSSFSKLTFQDPANISAILKADIIFSALPHHASMEIVPDILKKGKRVVDLSADFRLKDAKIYEAWYGKKHIAKGLLKKAVYGLPELYRDKIKHAELVANPGCYPTGAILGLAPLLKVGLIDTKSIIIDSKSGVSGAGRAASLDTSFAEVSEGFKAYKVGEHRHTPEIEQGLSLIAGKNIKITFTPHLLPVNRGILSTMYAQITSHRPTLEGFNQGLQATSQKNILNIYKKYYASTSFEEKKEHIKNNGKELSKDYAKHIEGVESLVRYKGPVKVIVEKISANIRSGFSYCGSKNINSLWKRATFIRISEMGLRESGPHDVIKIDKA